MEHKDDRGDCQLPGQSGALVVPATLRPPKRHRLELIMMQGTSPKRKYPSLSPSPSLGVDSSVLTPRSGSEDDLQMDWAPTSGPIVAADDVELGGVENTDPPICYGTLCNAHASFKPRSEAKRLVSDGRRFCLLGVVRSGPHYVLSTRANKLVAQLDLATCRSLRSMEGLQSLRLTGVIESAAVSHTQERGVPLSINVYGPLSSADQVGKVLAAASAFLQHPFFLEPGCKDYFNPQMFRASGKMQNLTHLVGLTEQDLRAKAISDGVQHILESLDEIARFDCPDVGVEWEPQGLLTCLTDHQVTALRFIRLRESHSHCQAMHQKLRHVTNIPPQYNIPSYSTGGILADAMGLGKTLTMISTIVSTIIPCREHLKLGLKTGATLVVVSSVQVLHVWEAEIKKHVNPNTLRTCRFHRKNRPTSPSDLNGFDVVLTTYSTLSSGLKNQGGILHQVEWYRVVLDEAHWIRNQGSKQFKAVASLKSIRRWCLTGTPIQNSLNDLVSLLAFLHLEPFSSRTIFGRHILEPLAKDEENGGFALRELLRTVCLRRDSRLLQLPKPQVELVEVILQQEERALYNEVLAQCTRDLDEGVSSGAKIRKYGILFATIIKLRRLCNHGVSAVLLAANSAAEAGLELDIKQGCEFCSGADEDRFELVNQDSFCSECGRELLLMTKSQTTAPRIALEAAASDELHPFNGISDTTMFKGVSSKVQAVINRLDQAEHGSKSLVFSYWTATLDVLEEHLKTRRVSYLRIDGTTTDAARLQILQDFKDNDRPVLLMTVGTGAVGLNLTAANYVHIVEPQWNPAIEEQAVARALRMGQKRPVTVVRYVTKNSIEENIFELQRRKRNLAKFTLDGVTKDGTSETLDDLHFVLDHGFAA